MSAQAPRSTQGSVAVGVIVAILILGAVGTLGYYQFYVAKSTSISTTSSPPTGVTCPSSACVNVTILNGAATTPPGFTPDTVTVVIGKNNTVFWTNTDSTGVPHTVTPKTGPSGGWTSGSGTLNQGDTYQYTFTVPGTYTYYCTFHPSTMSGTVIVVAGSSTAPASSST